MNEKKYTFAVLALGHLGDTILVEPLCRNIKQNYPNSKIIFIVNNLFKEIAFGFDSVDEVYGYDKKKMHKGIIGCFKFAMLFRNKGEIDYAIITHPHERSIFTAKIIGAKNIISLPIKMSPLNLFINKKRQRKTTEIHNTYKADYNSNYISSMCEVKTLPVTYKRRDIDIFKIRKKFNIPENYIVLSPTSKQLIKDWDYRNVKEFIINNKYTTVLVGTEKANTIAKQLKKNSIKFIDVTNKTSITELGGIIKGANACVSVDTGTFHLSYAQNVKTIGLFFNSDMTREWVPTKSECIKVIQGKKYINSNSVVCEKDIYAEDVINTIENFQ